MVAAPQRSISTTALRSPTQTIARETITSQTDQSGTLGYSGTYTVSIPTGTADSELTQDSATVQQDEAKVAQDEHTLAAARKLAGPQNAHTLSAAASDRGER